MRSTSDHCSGQCCAARAFTSDIRGISQLDGSRSHNPRRGSGLPKNLGYDAKSLYCKGFGSLDGESQAGGFWDRGFLAFSKFACVVVEISNHERRKH
jgi:hypothetical protein